MRQTYCIIDQRPIPQERAMKRSVTCSAECAKALAKARRDAIDKRKCRLCGVPSTPEQRKLFQQWRRETGQTHKPGPRPASDATVPKQKERGILETTQSENPV